VKLVIQRAIGDCGIASLGTLLELSYEDVYIAAAQVDRNARGRNGIRLASLISIGKKLGVSFLQKRHHEDDDEGLLVVTWRAPHSQPFGSHLVALAHGVVADPADGIVLPVDDYLTRYKATAGSFLELQ
jgi:hypothetical protein